MTHSKSIKFTIVTKENKHKTYSEIDIVLCEVKKSGQNADALNDILSGGFGILGNYYDRNITVEITITKSKNLSWKIKSVLDSNQNQNNLLKVIYK
jgi:hypothetical protein